MFDGCFIAEFSLVWLLRFGHTDHAFEYTGVSSSMQIVLLPRKGASIMTNGFHPEKEPKDKKVQEKSASERKPNKKKAIETK